MVAGYDDGEGVVMRLVLCEKVGEAAVGCDGDARIQLLNARDGCFGALGNINMGIRGRRFGSAYRLANVFLPEEVARAQIILRHGLIVDDRE